MAYKQSQGLRETKLIFQGLMKSSRSLDVVVDFEAAEERGQKSQTHGKLTLPLFNKDRLSFTPTFLLPMDQQYYRLNEAFERFQFEQKIERSLSFLRTPQSCYSLNIRPSAPHSHFCQICQLRYQDYFEHIRQEKHKQLAKKNIINKSITQLCGRFSIRRSHKICKQPKESQQNIRKMGELAGARRSERLKNIEFSKHQSTSTNSKSHSVSPIS